MKKAKYEILVPDENIVYKDDGKRLVLFLIDNENEDQIKIYNLYYDFIHEKLLDILLNIDYSNKDVKRVYGEIRQEIIKEYDIGAAEDICDTLLSNLYLADRITAQVLFKNQIGEPDTIIVWSNIDTVKPQSQSGGNIRYDKRWLYSGIGIAGVVIGILVGLLISFVNNSTNPIQSIGKSEKNTGISIDSPKYKINAVYDSKKCMIYFGDTKFENIDYYIDYQNKVKSIDDINWKLQSSTMKGKDTLFLKDNCTVYLKGEMGNVVSEIQVINVSYYDFITELLVTQDPLIKSMLVTNSSTPFSNTTFMVDGVPQQVSYYKSSELINYIKRGYRVTGLKTIGSNVNPTNKNYPRLAKITIQKQ